MWWKNWCVVVLAMFGVPKGFAQLVPVEVSLSAGGLAMVADVAGFRAYPALLGKKNYGEVVVCGSRLYGTPLGQMLVAGDLPMEGQGLGLLFQQRGGGGINRQEGRVSYGRALAAKAQMAVSIGVQMEQAQGYHAEMRPVAGLGLGLQVTERCQWLLQVDGIAGFAVKGRQIDYTLRTGLGYMVTTQVSLTAEWLAAAGATAMLAVGIHYQPTDRAWCRVSYMGAQICAYGGFLYRQMRLEMGLGWHPVLGLQQVLQISYVWKRREE